MSVALVFALGATPAHPLHTTVATVEWHGERRELDVRVRVFTQDLLEAVSRGRAASVASGSVADSTACRYATQSLSIRDAAGASLPVTRCFTERQADVTWIRLIVPAARPAGLGMRDSLLFECFPDQVNIVQSTVTGTARTMLFTTGDGPKSLT